MARVDNPQSPIPGKLKGLHLFHYDPAVCAQRVRFALGEKGLSRGPEVPFDSTKPADIVSEPNTWVSRRVSLPKKMHMTERYAAINPNMVVPALVHDGRLYLESMDIIAYLDDAFGGPRLVPQDEDLKQATLARVEQAKVLHRSIRFVTFYWGLGRLAILKPGERKALTDLAAQGSDGEQLVSFYEQYSTGSIPESVYFAHLKNLYTAFQEIDTQLSDGREFLMADYVTIADPFWSMKIVRLTECGYPVAEHHPNLWAWYRRMYQRPSFQNEVMQKNRVSNRIFRTKATIEALFGKGLKQAVEAIAV